MTVWINGTLLAVMWQLYPGIKEAMAARR